MKLVVVGSRGTLGARLVARLRAERLERMERGEGVGVEGVDFRARSASDVAPGPWSEVVAAADVVVNVGGPRVRPGLTDADYLREHVGVTEAAAAAMARGRHLIHVSSTAVFGARGAHLTGESSPAPERFPMSGYAAAKLAAEDAARRVAGARGLALTVLRPSMVYGPDIDSALESLLRLARRGISLRLRPKHLRQHLTHIELFVEVIRSAARRAEGGGDRPLLVADPFVLTNRDLDAPTVGRARLAAPVPLHLLGGLRGALAMTGRHRLGLDSAAVLALDNVFDTRETFDRLALSRDRFSRGATFDRYFTP